ncbi:MAG TPA: pentapeptide repeat-containing protein [Candidatus Angelobacter sp.]|nr:pentapeptide repeat-containing protein [Candidatus Angelobacter sp.]
MICALLFLSCGTGARAADDKPPLPPADENAILVALQAGQVADAQGRVLRTDFVTSLLLRPEKALPNGVRIRDARFSTRLDLSNFQVSSSLWLVGCQFADGIDLTGARIAGDFSLEQSHFAYPTGDHDANDIFNGMKVLGDTNLAGAAFDGPVDFTNAEFRGEFSADGAKFQAPDTSADFQYAQFRSTAFFRQAAFTGILKMWSAQIQDMTLLFDPAGPPPRIEMPQAAVQRNLAIQGGEMRYLGLAAIRVLGTATLGPLCVSQQLDLHKASFDTVSLNILPCSGKPPGPVSYVSGLRYSFLTSDNGGPPTDGLLQILSSSNYNGVPGDPNNPPDQGLFPQYSQFEAFLRAHDYGADADRVLVAGKRRERETIPSGWFSFGRWKSKLEDWSVGYGTSPLRPLLFCILFVILGSAILDQPLKMDWTDEKIPPQKYSAFWYTLDKFAPVIDLKVADAWQPKTVGLQRFALALRIFGWILVPLAAAALTGSFK